MGAELPPNAEKEQESAVEMKSASSSSAQEPEQKASQVTVQADESDPTSSMFRSPSQTAVDVGCGACLVAFAAVGLFKEWGACPDYSGKLLETLTKSDTDKVADLAIFASVSLISLLVVGLGVGLLGVAGAFIPYKPLAPVHYWVVLPVAFIATLCTISLALLADEIRPKNCTERRAEVGLVFAGLGAFGAFAWVAAHITLERMAGNTAGGLTWLRQAQTMLRRPLRLNALDIDAGVVVITCAIVALTTNWTTVQSGTEGIPSVHIDLFDVVRESLLSNDRHLSRCAVSGHFLMAALGLYMVLMGVAGVLGPYRPVAGQHFRSIVPVGLGAAFSMGSSALLVERMDTSTNDLEVGAVFALLCPAFALVWCFAHLVMEKMEGNTFGGLGEVVDESGNTPYGEDSAEDKSQRGLVANAVDIAGGLLVVLLTGLAMGLEWVKLKGPGRLGNRELTLHELFETAYMYGLDEWDYVAAARAALASLLAAGLYVAGLGVVGIVTRYRLLATLHYWSVVPVAVSAVFNIIAGALLVDILRDNYSDLHARAGTPIAFISSALALVWCVVHFMLERTAMNSPSGLVVASYSE